MHRKICKWVFYFNLNSVLFSTFKFLSIQFLRCPNGTDNRSSPGCSPPVLAVGVSCAAARLSPGEQLAGDRAATVQQPGRTQCIESGAELRWLWAHRQQYCWGCDFLSTLTRHLCHLVMPHYCTNSWISVVFPTGQTQAVFWALCACHQHTLLSWWQVRYKYRRRWLQVTACLFLWWSKMFYCKATAIHLTPFLVHPAFIEASWCDSFSLFCLLWNCRILWSLAPISLGTIHKAISTG